MSYAAKGERVFARFDSRYSNCSPPAPKRSDHRLKRFLSILDERAWHVCDEVRSEYFRQLMAASRTCLDVDQCHKYVPLEDLIKILMAEKDELIRQLQHELQESSKIQKEAGDSEILQNEISELRRELNKSREVVRQAMHKLENIDEIVNENKRLQCRLRCSEERVKYLEEKKKHLESELAELRSKSQIEMDLERTQELLCKVTRRGQKTAGMDEATLKSLATERNELQQKVTLLEKELEDSKKKEAEMENLKRRSESDFLDKEEIERENECFRKKLASMKCLEKEIQSLKRQGKALADKYKREAQKAADQMNKMSQASQELESLRRERDSLKRRVDELASYECSYNKLRRKLERVEAIIAENECLNSKMAALQKLEKENEYLRCRLEMLQEAEINAAEDKERIAQLQCAVADQEEEMKDLLCQIERLTSGREEEEMERLKCELHETNSKLKLCEEQLAEIPMLEAEIDELRCKLQACCRQFPDDKKEEKKLQKVEVRLPASSREIRVNYKSPEQKRCRTLGMRCEQKLEFGVDPDPCRQRTATQPSFAPDDERSEKQGNGMSCEEVGSLLESSKEIISCVLEDMIEHQKEMEELELCNKAMKAELEMLKAKVDASDEERLLDKIRMLEKSLEEKDEEICKLQEEVGRPESKEEEEEDSALRELNREMKAELEAACLGLKEVTKLEQMLEIERKARCEAEKKLRAERPFEDFGELPAKVRIKEEKMTETTKEKRERGREGEGEEKKIKLVKGEEEAKSEADEVEKVEPKWKAEESKEWEMVEREREELKLEIKALNKLIDELKKENELLRELQQPCPDFSKELDEKCALENLLSLLQAELDAYKGQKLSDECEALRNELKRVLEQNCQLKALVDCYRQRLDLEIKSKDLEKEKLGRGATWDNKNTSEFEKTGESVGGKNKECEEELNNLRRELGRLQFENEELKESLKDAELKMKTMEEPGEAEKELLKQLEKLKKEKETMAQEMEKGKSQSTGPGALSPPSELAGREDCEQLKRELEQLRKEKREWEGQLEQVKKEKQALTSGVEGKKGIDISAEASKKDCEKELEQLKQENARLQKLLEEHAKPMATTNASAAAKTDCEKELEQLRKDFVNLQKELAEKTQKTPDAGKEPRGMETSDAGTSVAAAVEKAKADCEKELEQLRRERAALQKQLADAGPEKAKEDCEKELEQLRKEKLELQKRLEESEKKQKESSEAAAQKEANAMAEKVKADCEKELERLKKEKEELGKRLESTGAGGLSDKERADLLKQLEDAKRERDELARKNQSAIPSSGGASDELEALRQRLKQMEEENAEKLKKLVDQHEKELENREKMYNENLSAMKSGYETDIRKLAERHKQSIMRLQELHEDEVQELNLNYETQFDAMQTQSEAAIDDVAKGSAAKIRKMTEQHSKEVKDIEHKFHVALDEKESEYLERLGGLQSALAKSRQELDTLKKKDKDGGSPDLAKAQLAREMSKIRRTSAQKINALKDKLKEERRKSESELKELKKKAKEEQEKKEEKEKEEKEKGEREREKGDGVCECELKKKKAKGRRRDGSCPLDFNEVLEKILEQGLDALSFNEIALVHRKTCCALEGIVMKSNANLVLELEPPVGDGCPHTPLLEADKQQLLTKIFALENEIQEKQKQTQDLIIGMEVAIKKERCRLVEVRNLLENEQEKNSKLKLLLSSQTKIESDLKKERDKLGNEASAHQLMCQQNARRLDEEMYKKKCLEAEVNRLRARLKEMSEGEPGLQQKDQLKALRLKLEQSAHQERRLALQLENEALCRMQLQCQLQALRQSFKQTVNLPQLECDMSFGPNPSEAKCAKERKNLDQIKEKKTKIRTKGGTKQRVKK